MPAILSTPTKIFAPGSTECRGGLAAKARAAAARLGGQTRYREHGGNDNLDTRILDQLTAAGVDVAAVRRIPGCVSPSAAILVDAQGEQLVCACNDPRLDAAASWRPLERDADCHGVLGDVRWPEGMAAVFDPAARHGILRVFDGAVGPRETLVDLAKRATPAVFCSRGWHTPPARPLRGAHALARAVPGLVSVAVGPDGFLWHEGPRERRIPAPKMVAISTLVAGDVRHGAFTLALAGGRDVAGAGRMANAAAAIKCSRAGGRLGTPR